MRTITLIALALIVTASAFAQPKPRQHVYRDTIKTVQERVDYAPDTIPVYFKEITIDKRGTTEEITAGYIVWQTYVKVDYGALSVGSSGSGWAVTGNLSMPDWAKNDYHDSAISGKFLYLDYKPVTNKIIYAIKR